MKGRSLLFFELMLLMVALSSCGSLGKMDIYSDNRYQPIVGVETSHYRSVQEREGQNPDIAVGLAISGGGSRAQYFGLGVLIALNELKNDKGHNFLDEVDYISTVSGGGFAAGYYLTLRKHDVLHSRTLLEFWGSYDRKVKLQEFLYKSANPLSVRKLWRYERNLISESYPDMIDYKLLQRRRIYRNKPISRLYLADFFVPTGSERPVQMPMFVTNGTIYSNGERFPFMPHIIDNMNITGSYLPKENFNIQKGYGMPLSYAIAGSAAFPGVLPMLKFKIKGNNAETLRVIDGGANDNLGYKTLLELLDADSLVTTPNKKALIVNCSGFGIEDQLVENSSLGIGELMEKSLMYAVSINLITADSNITDLSRLYGFAEENVIQIGFSTIKEHFYTLLESASEDDLKKYEEYRDLIERGKVKWNDLFYDFVRERDVTHIFSGYNEDKGLNRVSEIPQERFDIMGLLDVFALYELSAHVKTKIKIRNPEREILILAGRFAVYLKEAEIRRLMD